MKKTMTTFAVLLLAGSALAQNGQDGSVRFDGTSPYGGRNGGGEFRFSSVSGRDFGTFRTFCVELDEHISAGTTYNFDIATAARDGGTGGPSPDPLDIRTAALYEAFVNGTLAHYDYDNSGDGGQSNNMNRQFTAAALQAAIWEIEEERSIESTDGNASVRALANYYVDTLSTDLANAGLGASVRILNLWTSNGGNAQDVLVMIPLPGAGALATAGLAGLAIRRRRRF